MKQNGIQQHQHSGIELKVLSRRVRCAGVGIDPLDPERNIDIPHLLSKHFPEHGPFLGVYASIEFNGDVGNVETIDLCLGDYIELIEED